MRFKAAQVAELPETELAFLIQETLVINNSHIKDNTNFLPKRILMVVV